MLPPKAEIVKRDRWRLLEAAQMAMRVEFNLKVPAMNVERLHLDEVVKHLAWARPGCRHVGVRLSLIRNEDTSGFVGGMP